MTMNLFLSSMGLRADAETSELWVNVASFDGDAVDANFVLIPFIWECFVVVCGVSASVMLHPSQVELDASLLL